MLDLPISAAVEERMATETGIRLGAIDRVPIDDVAGTGPRQPHRRPQPTARPPAGLADQLLRRWVVLVEHLDWATGASGTVSVQLSLGLLEMYRGSPPRSALGGAMSNVLLVLLAAVAALFLLIQGVALLIGLALARQITGAVHDLFTGTQHLRNRDFTHVIPVRARDQLGELADSFNAMTGEVTRLLTDVAQEGAPRAGIRHRPRDPDEAAAAGAADRARAGRLGLLRTGARGGRRLLRCLPGGRARSSAS